MLRFKLKCKDGKDSFDLSFSAIFKIEQRQRLTRGGLENIDVTTCVFNRASDVHPIAVGFAIRRFDDNFSPDTAYRVAFGRAVKDLCRLFPSSVDKKDIRGRLLAEYNEALSG